MSVLHCFTDNHFQNGLDSWKDMYDGGIIENLEYCHDLTENGLFVLFCMRFWTIYKQEICEDVEQFVYDTAQVTPYAPLFVDYGDVELAFDELLERGFIRRC